MGVLARRSNYKIHRFFLLEKLRTWPIFRAIERNMSPQGLSRLIGVAVLVLVAIIVLATATFVVPPGSRGVLVTLGKVSPDFKKEGFGFKTPLITQVIEMSVKQRTVPMRSPVISKDLQEVQTELKVLYRVPEESVVQIYQQYKGDPFTSLIQPRVDEAIKEVTKGYDAQEIVQGRARVKEMTLQKAKEKIGTILNVVDVVIEDISLSANLEAAIERKMVQEQEANKALFEQQRAEIEAQTAVIKARGEAESIRIRGEALTKNPEIIQLDVIKMWNGKTPKVIGGESGGANMLLPLGAVEEPRK